MRAPAELIFTHSDSVSNFARSYRLNEQHHLAVKLEILFQIYIMIFFIIHLFLLIVYLIYGVFQWQDFSEILV